jgi:hypothetical protein
MRIEIVTGTIGRRRTRVINPADVTIDAPGDPTKWRAYAFTGGTVANAYKYPAVTDACLIVRDPAGRVVVWVHHGGLSANKATSCGAARVCLPGSEALFDGRVKRAKNGGASRAYAWSVIRRAHAMTILQTTDEGELLARLAPLDRLSAEELAKVVNAHVPAGNAPDAANVPEAK